VPAGEFDAAEQALQLRFAGTEGAARTPDFASFTDEDRDPPLGIQLTAIDGAYDVFLAFREALAKDRGVLREYNALKERHDGGDMEADREDKAAFVEAVLSIRGLNWQAD
jgi:GrpB-like predicted nucleotidyltransferase (UPF0157 family)